MMEGRDPRIYLDDIVGAGGKAIRFTEGISFDEFDRDDRTSFAVVRALEIIGESAKRVPPAVRDRAPEIPWQDMAGMRDKLIHGYHGVELRVVRRTVREDLPDLIAAVRILRRQFDDAG